MTQINNKRFNTISILWHRFELCVIVQTEGFLICDGGENDYACEKKDSELHGEKDSGSAEGGKFGVIRYTNMPAYKSPLPAYWPFFRMTCLPVTVAIDIKKSQKVPGSTCCSQKQI